MTQASMTGIVVESRKEVSARTKSWSGRKNLGDRVFFGLLTASAVCVPLLVMLFLVILVLGAWPSMRTFGFAFLSNTNWDPNPDHEEYGALSFIVGTLVTSLLALCIAAPIGIGVAAFLNEVLPARLRSVIGFLLEILATVPSVIYGIWGIFVLAPWMRNYIQPALGKTLGFLPLFRGPMFGLGMLTGAVILSIMITPIIVSISLEAIRSVPASYREAALALGATRWEMIRMAVLPPARSGFFGACVLALGRALGETMAVTMVIGNGMTLSMSLFAPGNTIASGIANQFSEAADLQLSALIELALILFGMTLVVNLAARYIVGRMGIRGEMLA